MNNTSSRRPGPRRRRTRIRSFVTALQILILLCISASVGIGLAMFVSLSTVLPKIDDVEAPEATIIYSCDGEILARIFREDRTNVPFKDIPQSLREATVAIEDTRFYQHSGLDMRGIARAIWTNLRGGRMAQGGSTITQQLARNVYLSQKKTVQRKAQEAVLAILMERHFEKNRILELYLNRVYYGSGAFGVEAASKIYFGKDVSRISLSESALLAGMPQKPSGYSPHDDLEAAIGRRNVVLNRMAELGYISLKKRDNAKNEKIHIIPRASGRRTYKAAHFVDYVVKELRDRYGDDLLFNGGLRVWTTLNYDMQQAAEKALRQGVHKFEASKRVTEGCFVAIESRSGYIRAMVGSVDPKSEFNRCTQGIGQQPGSSFKAFVYTAAFAEVGLKPTDRVLDAPISYPGAVGETWRPRNYDGRYHGRVTIKKAIAMSMNIPAIKTAENVGINKVMQYAELMGIHSKLQPYLSTAIGASDVLPLEMASAYGTFANGGKHVEPVAVVRVTNSRGEIVEDFTPEGRQVIPESVNEMIDECLRAVVTQGTGRSANPVSEARGKTGTTNDDRDAWFIGYVPDKLVAACWVGNDDNSSMRGAYGGKVCAPIWTEFMLKALPLLDKIRKAEDPALDSEKLAKSSNNNNNNDERDRAANEKKPITTPEAEVTTVEEPDTAEYAICNDSGQLSTDKCPSHMVSFARDAQPRHYCTIHKRAKTVASDTEQPTPQSDATMATVTICPESGLLAGPSCPKWIRKRLLVDQVPTQVCNVHSRETGR